MRLPRPTALLALALAGCSDVPLAPGVLACDDPPTPIAFHQTVTGALDADEDCLLAEGRLSDDFALTLDDPTLFTVSLVTRGYRPLMPLYRDGAQVSGWASSTDTALTREHLFPAGDYVLRSTSFERVDAPATPASGGYTLSTAVVAALPQEGCSRETSVTYGSVARGRLTPDDCEATPEDGDPTVRRLDGYDFLVVPGRAVRVTATADVRYRFAFWANGQVIDVFEDVAAGDSVQLTVGGIGFLDFYVMAEEEGVFGAYTLRFDDPPPEG